MASSAANTGSSAGQLPTTQQRAAGVHACIRLFVNIPLCHRSSLCPVLYAGTAGTAQQSTKPEQMQQEPPPQQTSDPGNTSTTVQLDPQKDEARDARETLKKEWEEAVRKTKPKDTAAGLKSGLATAAAGVASGVVGLFAAPIVGAKEEGAAGFAKGLATGKSTQCSGWWWWRGMGWVAHGVVGLGQLDSATAAGVGGCGEGTLTACGDAYVHWVAHSSRAELLMQQPFCAVGAAAV